MEQAHFRFRAFTALLMLLCFISVASSGAILFLAPRGHFANASGWALLGLTRWRWEDLHASCAFLMLAAAVSHVWLNRKPLMNHLRQRTVALAPLLSVRLEALVAVALFAIVVLGSAWQAPPFSYLSQLHLEMGGARGHGP